MLNNNQFGFRSGRETSDAAVRLFTCISNAASTNKSIHIIFLDIAKAYDSVQHWALKDTLLAHGLHDMDVALIMDMVEGYSTSLLMAEGKTAPIQIKAGLRQGDGISPILYSLFLNPLLEWIHHNPQHLYTIGNDDYLAGAYADDMTLISDSGVGIQYRLDMVNTFMAHNNIKINCSKSSYRWARDDKATISCDGESLDEQGDIGMFMYLGWTTNLKLNWDMQVEKLVEAYQATVCSTVSKKGLMLDQKIRIINTIGNATIAYRTRLMHTYHNDWLKDLDVWMVKVLNKLGRLAPQTDKAYWHTHRGLRNLYCENTTGFINHSVEKILNDPLHTLSVKACTLKHLEKMAPRTHIRMLSGMTDNITDNFADQKIQQALHKADIRWMPHLLLNGRPITTKQFDLLQIDAPTSIDPDMYDGWGHKIAAHTRKWIMKKSPTTSTTPDINENPVDLYTDGSKHKYTATQATVIVGDETRAQPKFRARTVIFVTAK